MKVNSTWGFHLDETAVQAQLSINTGGNALKGIRSSGTALAAGDLTIGEVAKDEANGCLVWKGLLHSRDRAMKLEVELTGDAEHAFQRAVEESEHPDGGSRPEDWPNKSSDNSPPESTSK